MGFDAGRRSPWRRATGIPLCLVVAACLFAGCSTPSPVRRVARRVAHKTPKVWAGGTLFDKDSGPALITTYMWSDSLQRRVQVVVYLPPNFRDTEPRRYPLLILLHGVPGSGPQVMNMLEAAPTLDRLIRSQQVPPMIVVAPSDGPTRGTDTEWENSVVKKGWNWASFVADDLLSWAEEELPVCTARWGHAIGGLSMGAFGAVNIALRNLSKFGAVTAWSGYFVGNTPKVEGPTGSPGWRENSPLVYLPGMIGSLRQMPLRISFYSAPDAPGWASSEAFARLLALYHIPYHFTLGGHLGVVWRGDFPSQLRWLAKDFSCSVGRAA